MKFDSNKNSKSLAFAWGFIVLFILICIVFPLLCTFFCIRIQDLKNLVFQRNFREIIFNTFLICICSTSLSVLVGYIFAYAIVKVKIPGSKFFSFIPILHLITPPFVGGLSFILLFGRQGFFTHKILGLDISLYGFWGLLIAQTLCFFPLAYLICVQSLKGINTNLEQAARGMGASELKIFFTITLPLSLPGIFSSFLFIAVSVLSDFGNPLIVGGRFKVLAVEIYTQLTGWLKIGTSASLGIVLLLPSVLLFILQNKVNRKIENQIASTKQNSFYADNKKSSVFTKIIFTILVLFISLLVLAQMISIIAGSFQKLWGINTSFTTEHIKGIFRYSKELRNSILFSLVAAVFCTFIACVSSFLVHRTKLPLRQTINVFAQIPSAIPGSLLGLSILIASNKLNFKNSAVLILIAMIVAFLPFAYKIISNSFGQISSTLDESAISLGANKLTVFSTIIVPISADGIFGGFIYDFIRGVGTLSAVIFLVSFKTPLASISLVNLAEQGDWGKSAALAMVLTILTFSILGIGFLIKKIFSRKQKWLFFR